MIDKIKTIKDKALFNRILNEFFMNGKSYVKSSSGNIQVKFLNCSGGLAAVRIPFNVNPPQNSLMFTRNKDDIIFAYMKFWEARDADTFIFNPEKFQIVTAARKDERKTLSITEDKSPIYATNIITDHIIRNSLSGNKEIVDKIKERIIYDNEKEYDYIRFFFADDETDDPRMKYFHENRDPIFIKNFKNDAADIPDRQLEHYMNSIYKTDAELMKNKGIVSEAAVPLMYDSKISYGYIQINGTSPFTNGTLAVVKRTAALIEQLCMDNKLFTCLHERVLVSNVSNKGLGIVFKEKKYIPYYKEKSLVSLDLILPNHRKASVLARVRHLEMLEDKFIKAGLEILEMDKTSITNYEIFIKNMVNAA